MVHTPINAANTEHDLPTKNGRVQCPSCNAWRPAFCVTKTIDEEWLGDCCISRMRREGIIIETQYIEE